MSLLSPAGRWPDFREARLRWTLPDGTWGDFAVEALLSSSTAGADEFVLSAGVAAGNVFAEREWIKRPPYMYQAAFSRTHHRIFRSRWEDGQTDDNIAPNRDVFREVNFAFGRDLGGQSLPTDALRGALAQGRHLFARSTFFKDGTEIVLTFPVKHINCDAAGRMFQVETGPVLTWEGTPGDPQGLSLAYVIFGRTDRIEVLHLPRTAGSPCRIIELEAKNEIWAPQA